MSRVWARRLPGAIAAAALVASAQATPLHAFQDAVRVEHAGPDTISVATGERGSIAFRIVNEGDAPVFGATEVIVPEGWRAVGLGSEVEVPPGASVVRVVTFYAPAAAAGLYTVGLQFSTRDGGVARDGVHVVVPERRDLEITVEQAPEWSTAGEAFAVAVRVTNVGNVATRFGLSLASPFGIPARADTTPRWLEPGESESILIDVLPPADLPRAVVHSMRVAAVADGTVAETFSRVEVLPGPHAKREPRPGLPAELRFRASEDPRAGPPIRFHAAGPVRPGSPTRVTALLQGPGQAYSVFGEPDIYRIGLRSPRFTLDLGDNLFRLSRLTEPGKQGMGIGGSGRVGAFSAGGFVQRDRRSFRPDSQYAAFVAASPVRELSLRGNWLRTDNSEGRREVLTGETSLQVPGWFVFRGELGIRPGRDAMAHSLDLTAQRGPLTVTAARVAGDTAFGGVSAGLSIETFQLGVRPWRALHLWGSMQDQSIERALSGVVFRSTQRSARVSAGWGSAFSVEGQHFERASESAASFTSQSARSLRVRLGLSHGPLTIYPELESGLGARDGAEEVSPFWRAGVRTSLRSRVATISSNLEYFTGGTLHRSLEEEGLAGTASAALQLGTTAIRLSAHGTRYLAPLRRDNLVVDAIVDHTLPFGHSISVRIMNRASDGLFQRDDLIALLDYSIPLKLPTGGRGGTASVHARVRDGATGAPLGNVIVRVGGRRAATDRHGRLSVRGLEPGVHYLDIDRGTMGAGRVATVAMPMRLELGPGERRSVDLALVSAGTVTVRTHIVRASSASGRAAPGDPEPMERVVVDFRHGDQRIRRESDRRGIIEVRDLRPGLWTLRIAGADLPPFHRFDRDSASVEVTGGGHSELTFSAAPVQRRVEIVATADLTERPSGEVRSAAAVPAQDPPAQPAAALAPPRTMRRKAGAPILGVPAEPSPPDRAADRAAPVRGERRILGVPAARSESPEAARAPLATVAPQGFTISVVAGDQSLRSIAALVYGNRALWPRIWLANRDVVSDPDRLFVGQVLRIPPAGPLTEEEKAIARRYPQRENR